MKELSLLSTTLESFLNFSTFWRFALLIVTLVKSIWFTQFVRKDLFPITYGVFIIDFIISIILTNIYYKLFKLPEIEDIDMLIKYINFFKSNPSDLLYIEAITWFSHLIKDAYIKPNECDCDEFNSYINSLYLILRPNNSGLCTATKRKSSFVALCIKIINKENISEDISNFKKAPTEEYHSAAL